MPIEMRIIAGEKRGMRLFTPKAGDTRPITDRVKESLFSVLFKYDLPSGKVVADLFCGVGSLGLEALSRGAAFVTFVEKDPRVVAVLSRNVEKAGFVKQSKVLRANAFKTGAPVGFEGRKCALVFVDPPYACTVDVGEGSPLSSLLELVSEQVIPSGFVVVRTRKHTELLEHYGRFGVIERRQWGTMSVTILQREEDDEQTGGSEDN
ncbi:MAG: 16S rRNA (guanine(966)-N(2))-methyltransferase RsmD [Planctomycetota bacterium]|jgi:16S rRNA (guanine(966)-N(2))-methyltransferase RsmD